MNGPACPAGCRRPGQQVVWTSLTRVCASSLNADRALRTALTLSEPRVIGGREHARREVVVRLLGPVHLAENSFLACAWTSCRSFADRAHSLLQFLESTGRGEVDVGDVADGVAECVPTEPHKAGSGDCSSPPHAARTPPASAPSTVTATAVDALTCAHFLVVSPILAVRTGGCPHTLRISPVHQNVVEVPKSWVQIASRAAAQASVASGRGATGLVPPRTAARTSPRRWRRRPAVRPRTPSSCSGASPPANRAGPVDRAGFTEVLVTGMLARWIRVSDSPIARGAKPFGARVSVAPRMT